MAKAKINKMLEFESILNTFLKEDIPLALLDELYNLSNRQKGFRKNRVFDYSYKDDVIGEELLDNNLEVSDSYYYMVHWIEELTPDRDRVIELFKEREDIKEKISTIERQFNIKELPIIKEVDDELSKLNEEEVKLSLAISKDINQDIILDDDGEVVANEDIVDFIKKKYNLSDSKLAYYNEIHLKYTSLKMKKDDFIKKLASKNINNYDEFSNRLENINSEIISRNIKLANWIIRAYFKGVPCEMEEMQGYALEALVESVYNFDVSKGCYFSTFAVPNIKHFIQRYFKELVGINWNQYVKVCRYTRDIREYQSVMGTTSKPSFEDLFNSGLFGYSYTSLKEVERLSNFITIPFSNVLPLDPVDEIKKKDDPFKTFEEYEEYDDYEEEVHDKLNIVDDEYSVFDIVDANDLKTRLSNVLNTLTEREQAVLRYRYGLDDGQERTLEETGKKFNRTRETIRQIEDKAFRKLRHPSRANILIDRDKPKKREKFIDDYPAWIKVKTKINSDAYILSRMLVDYMEDKKFDCLGASYLTKKYCNFNIKDSNLKSELEKRVDELRLIFHQILGNFRVYGINNIDTMQHIVFSYFKIDLPIEFFKCYSHYVKQVNEENERQKSR